ncbi:rhomboid family intramembrane serine protease [Neolewinella lacunae]|uniref:Rhomboid family intramembrane serine protease n=1 Tax=Neolewinella lacunae TaxID=1517758 RepID=A0A923TD37_9BACT|nr:rhomboid family intramembrane serine protease [Neolewinella lacunae]MBC6994407.1 rhomboid family intramembrane serine protease [Neolewinella lacunae]MDN3633338.1 rhomboid family intramembrane serine protease [Neolewinella lacunae]
MLQSIWDDVRREFSFGNMINKIIIVNVSVYLVVSLMWVFLRIFNGWEDSSLYDSIVRLLAVSHDWWHMLTRPWTLLTHMFLHLTFWHLLWNMLFLFWFGRIFGDLLGDRRVLPLYILGGLAGFLAYFFAYNLTSLGAQPSIAYGASGAVLCILVATGIFAPDYNIRLFILGNVRLKYIVFFSVMVQVLALGSLDNIGGTFDHLGGVAMGAIFAFYLRQGTDLTQPVARFLRWVENTWTGLLQPSKEHKTAGPRAAYRSGQSVKEPAGKTRPSFMRKAGSESSKTATPASDGLTHQEQVDAILEKIKDRGYESLTKDEKDFLFRASNRN